MTTSEPDHYVSSACRVSSHEDCPPTVLCACRCHGDGPAEDAQR